MPTVTLEEVVGELQRVQEATSIDEPLKKSVVEKLETAREWLQQAETSRAAEQRFRQLVEQTEPLREEVTEALRRPPPTLDLEALEDQPLSKLRPLLEQAERQYQEANEQLAEVNEELQRRTSRGIEIPTERREAETLLAEAEKQLAEKPAEDQPALWNQVEQMRWAAQRQAALAKLAELQQEEASYEARRTLLPQRRELALRNENQLEENVQALRALVTQRNTQEAEQQAAEVLRELPAESREDAYFEPLRERVESLAGKWTARAADLARTSAELTDLESEISRVDESFELMRNRVEGGTTSSFGLVLRSERATLPSVRRLRRDIAARDRLIRQANSNLFIWRKRRDELHDLATAVREELEDLPPRAEPDPRATLAALLAAERNLLAGLVAETEAYVDQLVRVNAKEENFADLVQRYTEFIDKRVYWVRSTGFLTPGELAAAVGAAGELLQRQHWAQVGYRLLGDVRDEPWMYAALLGALAVLLVFQSRLRRQIAALGQTVSRSAFLDFAPTLRTLLLTVLVAAPWPALLLYAAARLNKLWIESGEAGVDTLRAVSGGLLTAALSLFALAVIYQVCRPMGLAEAHFRWNSGILRVLRKNLRWLIFLGTPLVFLVVSLETLASLDPDEYGNAHNTLGRTAFLLFQVLLFWTLQAIFRPRTGVFAGPIAAAPGSWVARLQNVWYPALLLIPVLFAGMALIGFYDTSLQLTEELAHSLVLIASLVLLIALFDRWVRVGRGRLALRHALEARAHRPAAGEADSAPTADRNLDLSGINEQIHRLVRNVAVIAGVLGLWLIWRDVLPALTVLDDIAVIPLGPETSLSVSDLIFLGLAVVITIVAARHGPSLIEFLLLQRLPLAASVRYAISTLSQYVIIAVGIIITAARIGIQWDLVVWMLAPLGVGLGFGLQEVFSNFVCGLVLLFEQPIRVGDVVTVGDTTGVVTRIRIRATTIRNWDQQELVLPNKDLITGSFVNWTLSSTINRVVIPVGVAYGSDTERAVEILHAILDEHPHILREPAPLVTFEGFGDSTLNIVVRACVASMEYRLSAIHELHTQIDRRFKQAGIEIAFPQRDLHIRSIPRSVLSELGRGNGRGGTGGERRPPTDSTGLPDANGGSEPSGKPDSQGSDRATAQ